MQVEIGAYKVLREYTPEQKVQIMNELSLLNPAYVSAKKFTSYSRISIPMYLEYFTKTRDALVVPRGYHIPFKNKVVLDERFTLENVEYPKFLLKLRGTQKEAAEAYLKSREDGNGVIILPTGKGKSILGLYLAGFLKQRVLIVVHKDDLVDGWKKDAKISYGLRPKQVGLIKGKVFRIGKQITVTTIQTLSRLPIDQLKELQETFSMIICDECHHCPARTFEVASTFPAYDRIGLTATDIRNDGLGKVINYYFGKVCYRFEESNDDEDIIPPNKVFINIKESKVNYNPPLQYTLPNRSDPVESFYHFGKRYVINELDSQDLEWFLNQGVLFRKPINYNNVMKAIWTNEEFTIQVLLDVLREFKKGKSLLVLCIEKEHCRLLYDSLIAILHVPEDSIQLYYGDATESKSAMKAKAESRETLITIATYAIAKEGTNVKAWERIFLAMTVNNELDTVQAIGRGRRRVEGKEELIVYDYRHPGVRGARNHGETRDRVYKQRGFVIKSGMPKQPTYQITKGFRNISK